MVESPPECRTAHKKTKRRRGGSRSRSCRLLLQLYVAKKHESQHMAEARARVRETHHFINLPLPLPPLAAPQGAFIGSLCHMISVRVCRRTWLVCGAGSHWCTVRGRGFWCCLAAPPARPVPPPVAERPRNHRAPCATRARRYCAALQRQDQDLEQRHEHGRR